MPEPFLGEIRMVSFAFAPPGWALCDGQLLSVGQLPGLFSLLGTTYGGDGRSTFGLPDLRGRVPVHAGGGPGLSRYSLGQQGGDEEVSLREIGVQVSDSGNARLVPGGVPHENRPPYQVVNFIIALEGTFPPRS